jgi:arsenate reductase
MINILVIFLFSISSWTQEEPKTTIVFVCEHGGARSTIASVYFNQMAKDNHLPYRSIFRGLTPDSSITKETRKGLLKDGFDASSLSPTVLSSKDIGSKILIIALDCEPPTLYQPYQVWKGIPAISENYEAARNSIVKHLKDLIQELKANKTTSSTKN